MKSLYQAQLLDHYQHPRNKGVLAGATVSSALHNPSCGDSVSIEAIIADGRVLKLAFQGSGCVISQATASLLTEKLIGKTVSEVQALDAAFVQDLIGMTLGPTRLKCALLPLEAIKQAMEPCVTEL